MTPMVRPYHPALFAAFLAMTATACVRTAETSTAQTLGQDAPIVTTPPPASPPPSVARPASTVAASVTASTVTASTVADSTVTASSGASTADPAASTATTERTAPGTTRFEPAEQVPSADAATVLVQGITVPALGSGTTPYAVPTPRPDRASWANTHSTGYPATDLFVPGADGCGGDVISPVDGTIVEVRRANQYDKSTDNPALRGGKSVTIVGDDGVRYYVAHLASVAEGLEPGGRVTVSQRLGTVGETGRAGACHIHFSITPACPDKEWSVRRGVIWPWPYLDDWRDGGQRSPVDEVRQYLRDNPDACSVASADPHAADA